MTRDDDFIGQLETYLDQYEGMTPLPDAVRRAIRADLPTTRQMAGSSGGIGTMILPARFAIAAAAALIVTLVGINLLPSPGRSGLPSTSPSPSPSLQPSQSPTRVSYYPLGEIVAGRYSTSFDGVSFSFRMPSGWEGRDVYLSKSTEGPQDAEAILFWATFPGGWISSSEHTGLYVPCIDVLGAPDGQSVADLARTVSTVPGTELVNGPDDVLVGDRAAKQVSLFATYSILDGGSCSPGFFYSWDDRTHGGAFWGDMTIPGDTIRVWIVDVRGTLVFIEAETHWNASPSVGQEIQQIVDSIQFD
jgi:hypothetical protein